MSRTQALSKYIHDGALTSNTGGKSGKDGADEL